ncbi:helix-turn-helix domain-containing protein [Marinifilum flexuosum]|uniref:helix-turn-helix domain-containing protein n=1 Tax=Marinifilum flexuosum TaxID=1117708 RepID=UPI002492764E|nr:hypothetical protein [Marinifilum flexuosum]
MKNIEFKEWNNEGGHTRFHGEARQRNCKELGGLSKLIYLILCFHQDRDEFFTPSYQMMQECYGIGRKSYNTAKDQLEKIGFIKVIKGTKGTRDKITITGKGDKESWEQIQNVLIVTPCLTPIQKLFIALLHKEIYHDAESRSKNIYFSVNYIAKKLEPIGLSRKTVLKSFKELGDPESGYINILRKSSNSYEINPHAIYALYDFNFKAKKHSRFKYPIYTKVISGMYKFDMQRNKILIAQSNE